MLDNETIQIPCPGCGHKTEKTVGWLKHNTNFPCTCGRNIVLEKEEFLQGVRDAENEVKKFGKFVDNLKF